MSLKIFVTQPHPVFALVTTTSQTGVTLTKEAMKVVQTQLERVPHLDKWFVDIPCPPASELGEGRILESRGDLETCVVTNREKRNAGLRQQKGA